MTSQFDIVIRGGTIVDGRGGAPFEGDVAITGDTIVAVSRAIKGSGREEIDARGMLVTPGFVDVHTHYDGQAIWESRLSPSSGHGVTTVVVGNCGVGFAPCRKEDHARLIELMEGVEDIPGVVMTTGLTWDWETYPEFLNALDARPHDINIASYLPHSALRVYVMGERASHGAKATAEDTEKMGKITAEAIQAGAVGFATSRTLFHRSSKGDVIPTADAGEEELTAIARGMQSAGSGVFQVATDFKSNEDVPGEFAMFRRILRASGRPLTLSTAQTHSRPDQWRTIMSCIEEANNEGLTVTGQTMPRGIGLLLGLELTMHPFTMCPSYKEVAQLPLAEKVERMRDPALRARLIEEEPEDPSHPLIGFVRNFDGMFEGGDPIDYEPSLDDSIAARATRAGITPAELAYDILMKRDGHSIIFLPFANYAHGNLDVVASMMRHENFVLGLGDGGAHYGVICDASFPTFVLSHWTRDRRNGDKLTIPEAVRALTHDPARMIGFNDRGVIAEGYRADLNVIDYDRLKLHAPHVVYDLPAGGRRLTQKADGFSATVVNGKIVYRDGVHTGALPGRLVRGQQPAPAAHAQPQVAAAE